MAQNPGMSIPGVASDASNMSGQAGGGSGAVFGDLGGGKQHGPPVADAGGDGPPKANGDPTGQPSGDPARGPVPPPDPVFGPHPGGAPGAEGGYAAPDAPT